MEVKNYRIVNIVVSGRLDHFDSLEELFAKVKRINVEDVRIKLFSNNPVLEIKFVGGKIRFMRIWKHGKFIASLYYPLTKEDFQKEIDRVFSD